MGTLHWEMCLDDGMEMSTIPDWLMKSMEKSKRIVEAQPIDDVDDYSTRSNQEKEPKKAKILLNIARDETGMRIAQVVIPIGDVTMGVATPMDFHITLVALG